MQPYQLAGNKTASAMHSIDVKVKKGMEGG